MSKANYISSLQDVSITKYKDNTMPIDYRLAKQLTIELTPDESDDGISDRDNIIATAILNRKGKVEAWELTFDSYREFYKGEALMKLSSFLILLNELIEV